MKTFKCIISALLMCLLLSACIYIPKKIPNSGIYYCDELKISLDFHAVHAPDIFEVARLYKNDKTYENMVLHIGYDNKLYIADESDEVNLVRGPFKWKDNEITVENELDSKTYVFKKVDSLGEFTEQ